MTPSTRTLHARCVREVQPESGEYFCAAWFLSLIANLPRLVPEETLNPGCRTVCHSENPRAKILPSFFCVAKLVVSFVSH